MYGYQGMRYKIIVKSRRVVCPVCAGTAVRKHPMTLDCVDCKTHFKAVRTGDFDAELEYESDTISVSENRAG